MKTLKLNGIITERVCHVEIKGLVYLPKIAVVDKILSLHVEKTR